MTTKEMIQAEIDRMNEADLEELYKLVKDFAQAKQPGDRRSFMSKLKGIRIDAPEDFAANLDLYTSGEKRVEPNLR
ncbi:MAG TPA: hypothetical protein VNO70_06605 [Blastocatellia bacterium]|nr:hypothetical protein [Blastocatellia bacterium]